MTRLPATGRSPTPGVEPAGPWPGRRSSNQPQSSSHFTTRPGRLSSGPSSASSTGARSISSGRSSWWTTSVTTVSLLQIGPLTVQDSDIADTRKISCLSLCLYGSCNRFLLCMDLDTLNRGFDCLELCLYGRRELI